MFGSYQANALASVTSQLQTKMTAVASDWSWLNNENISGSSANSMYVYACLLKMEHYW